MNGYICGWILHYFNRMAEREPGCPLSPPLNVAPTFVAFGRVGKTTSLKRSGYSSISSGLTLFLLLSQCRCDLHGLGQSRWTSRFSGETIWTHLNRVYNPFQLNVVCRLHDLAKTFILYINRRIESGNFDDPFCTHIDMIYLQQKHHKSAKLT